MGFAVAVVYWGLWNLIYGVRVWAFHGVHYGWFVGARCLLEPTLNAMAYVSVVLLLDVGEESGIAQVAFAAGALEVAVSIALAALASGLFLCGV